MRLTRRDALVALTAAGVAVGGGELLLDSDGSAGPLDGRERATLLAAAEVLYPSDVADVEAFVERYVRGRAADDPAFVEGVSDALAYLDDYARSWHDEPFAALDPATRETALRRMDADTVDPDPDGGPVARVRHHVVDELLFALYTTPTGAELAGLENPPGYPGGAESYRRGPRS